MKKGMMKRGFKSKHHLPHYAFAEGPHRDMDHPQPSPNARYFIVKSLTHASNTPWCKGRSDLLIAAPLRLASKKASKVECGQLNYIMKQPWTKPIVLMRRFTLSLERIKVASSLAMQSTVLAISLSHSPH